MTTLPSDRHAGKDRSQLLREARQSLDEAMALRESTQANIDALRKHIARMKSPSGRKRRTV